MDLYHKPISLSIVTSLWCYLRFIRDKYCNAAGRSINVGKFFCFLVLKDTDTSTLSRIVPHGVTGEAGSSPDGDSNNKATKRKKAADQMKSAIQDTMTPLLGALGNKHQKSKEEVESTIALNTAKAAAEMAGAEEKKAAAKEREAAAKERESNALLLSSRVELEREDSKCKKFREALQGDVLSSESKEKIEAAYVAHLLASNSQS